MPSPARTRKPEAKPQATDLPAPKSPPAPKSLPAKKSLPVKTSRRTRSDVRPAVTPAVTPAGAGPQPGPARPARGSSKKGRASEEDSSPVFVGNSPIHGRGLFAARPIASGERIGVYSGPRSDAIDTYVLWVQDERGNEYGIDGRNEMRYVNHAADPNACFEGEELVALRAIPSGEEITHHYGEDWDEL